MLCTYAKHIISILRLTANAAPPASKEAFTLCCKTYVHSHTIDWSLLRKPKVSKVLSLSATSIEAWSYFVFPSLPSNSPNMSKAYTEWMERHQMVSSSHLIGTSHSQETSSTNSSFTCKSCSFRQGYTPLRIWYKTWKGTQKEIEN